MERTPAPGAGGERTRLGDSKPRLLDSPIALPMTLPMGYNTWNSTSQGPMQQAGGKQAGYLTKDLLAIKRLTRRPRLGNGGPGNGGLEPELELGNGKRAVSWMSDLSPAVLIGSRFGTE